MTRTKLLYPLVLLVLLLIVKTSPAQTQPCTPPTPLPTATEPNIFSEEQEVYLGDAVAEHIQSNYHLIEDSELTSYLNAIGARLTKHLPLNKLRFQFFLVELPEANAFVIPGGRIYVSRKLVAAAQSEDELAGVIAHELGHLVAHQGAIETTRTLRELLGVTSVGDRRDVFEKYNQMIENLNRKPGALRSGDREKGQLFADQAGFYALVAAGYDPDAMARFWDRITGTQGKKGSWLSDLFGTTRPEQKRLREMSKAADLMPKSCRQVIAANQSDTFKEWRAKVVAYSGLGRRESLHGVIAQRQLSPPLLSDIQHLRFSPDGAYVIAQDDAGINVLSREPFQALFRIDTPDNVYYATFTPDSKEILFYTDTLRVTRWSIAEARQIDAKEVVLHSGCLETELSPDGKLLACLDPHFDLSVVRVDTGEVAWKKKEFYAPDYSQWQSIDYEFRSRGADTTDLNLNLINMRFTPDGHYFVAGYRGSLEMGTFRFGNAGEVIDTATMTKISISDSVRRLIAGGFAFLGNDRMAGINGENYKKSAVIKFPSGEVLAEMELWRKGMTAATQGDYLLIRPIKDYPLGVMDLNTKTITKVNERSALDIYGEFFVAEMRNGQVGLYRMAKNEVVATAILSNVSLGRLRVAEVSPGLKWLALSGRSRGGVWNVEKGEAVLSLRHFQGAHLSDDGYFYADFPKTEEVGRNIAKFNLNNGDAANGPKLEGRSSEQYGQYVFKLNASRAPVTTPEKEEKDGKAKFNPNLYRYNTVFEMYDARTMTMLWAKTFPHETPKAWIMPESKTMALAWDVNAEAAREEIRRDPRLTQQFAAMNEKEGDYFLEILNTESGEEVGKLLVETGKGSFRVGSMFAAGDSVIVADTQNRVLVYSLKTGEQKGRVFGGYATVSTQLGLLCVENETGKIAVYDLSSLEKRDELNFPSSLKMLRFSDDGQRLFVLTTAQTMYIIDSSSLAKR